MSEKAVLWIVFDSILLASYAAIVERNMSVTVMMILQKLEERLILFAGLLGTGSPE